MALRTKWNLWLVNCGEPPLLYFNGFTEDEAQAFIKQSAAKAFDGSDADGFVMMRSDYPMPEVWPEKVPGPWRGSFTNDR